MNKWLFIAATVVLLLGTGCLREWSMADKNIAVTLTELAKEDVAALQAIRLAEAGDDVMLLSSVKVAAAGFPQQAMVLSAVSLKDTAKPGKDIFSIPQLLPAPARWDIALTEDNLYHLVVEKAGGAINTLVLYDSLGNQQSLTDHFHAESFSLPRFIRQKPVKKTDAVIAAVNSEQLISLPVPQGTDRSASVRLCTSGNRSKKRS